METHKHDLPPSFSVQVRPSTETGLGTQSDSMLAIAAFHWGRNQVLGDRVGGGAALKQLMDSEMPDTRLPSWSNWLL